MASREQILHRLNEELSISAFKDYGPNGLQVEGKRQVERVVTGVTASVRLIEEAIRRRADMLIVHHGIFWGGDGVIRGGHRDRLRLLLGADLTLAAYHLPLDGHPVLGNGAQLASALGFVDIEPFWPYKGMPVGVTGRLLDAEDLDAFKQRLRRQFPSWLEFTDGPEALSRIAVVTGGGHQALAEAAWSGCDALITGEASEPTMHVAQEEGIHFFAAGHHATETYGVKALVEWLQANFDVEAEFVDIPNPV
jgi:dinuclear metal center YbgI/SA1388 family protein